MPLPDGRQRRRCKAEGPPGPFSISGDQHGEDEEEAPDAGQAQGLLVAAKSIRTPKNREKILELVAAGNSLVAIGKMKGLPALRSIMQWKRDDEQFAKDYQAAWQESADADHERLHAITSEVPPRVEGKMDGGFVQWQRLRADTIKWTMSKKAPKKYGDQLNVEHGGNVTVQFTPGDASVL